MTVKLETSIHRYIGDTADTKPTGVPVGSTYLDRETDILYVTYDGTNWVAKDILVRLVAGDVNIGNVDIVTLPSGNLGQQLKAASLSVAPATDITDATYIGDIKFGESVPAGTNNIGKVDPVTATPTSYNLTLTLLDTEYSQELPANCRRFEFQARTEASVRYAFVTGKVAGSTAPYHTLKAGDYYDSGPINQASAPSTLYFAGAAGVIVEILAWT